MYVSLFIIIEFEDFDLDNILIDGKPHENILIYNISYKTLVGWKPLQIKFDKVSGFIRVYNGTTYFIIFGLEKYYFIYNSVRYLIGV